MEPSKIVVRYADGRVIKGYTQNFSPRKDTFHLHTGHPESSNESISVSVKDLKGIFFVRDFLGNRKYMDQQKFPNGVEILGRKAEVTFKDKEVMLGFVLGYDPTRPGFFLFPSDPNSNNIKVFVVSRAVLNMRFL